MFSDRPEFIWDTEPPTESGWYWFKQAYDDHFQRIIYVFTRPGHGYLCVNSEGMSLYQKSDFLSVKRMTKAIWAGPIQEPM